MKKHNTIFEQIIQKKTATQLLYQDNLVSAFYDIHPQAPIHVLIVPNIPIPTVNDITPYHEKTIGRLFTVAAKIAVKLKINESGYRLIVNCNNDAGQEIYHLHMHLLGGKTLGPLISNSTITNLM
ncbi:HIT domain-containing protein [Blochmannia endosymbiont of Polyrhachis (Hedomyrma) turneri]|uniref:HIT domain-containing protein n=1 Tax=Blochmannia endosymbiont of Polyrhachis (Hedomyrma) turneri TaxID=1505596 RepID=UPI00061A7035|nr:HIT domain-containing protein [Blochmannia endosymbiont of Polyrhachis (Hedomyrma) turneri]AKC59955.1 HIT-like protein hinT [Blochmannia endosymbiont of Polyrhachis (Hedomyrma) turneri]